MDRGSVAHVAGLGAESDHAVDRDRHDQHEDRDRADEQDVVDGVDLARRGVAVLGEPVDQERDRDADEGGQNPDRDHPRDRVPLAVDPRILLGVSGSAVLGAVAYGGLLLALRIAHGARVYWLPATGATGPEALNSLGGQPLAMVAEGRGRSAVVSPEGLCELGRLAVADRARDGLDGEGAFAKQLGSTGHPDALELTPEARRTGLRESALQLSTRSRDRPRDRVQRKVLVRVAALDDGDRIAIQLAPPADGRLADHAG